VPALDEPYRWREAFLSVVIQRASHYVRRTSAFARERAERCFSARSCVGEPGVTITESEFIYFLYDGGIFWRQQ
jgi:hypothetical protein